MKKLLALALLSSLLLIHNSAKAQENSPADTLECAIVGFHVGALAPSSTFSSAYATGSNTVVPNGNMYELYKGPYLNFGVDVFYKMKSNWLFSIDGSLIIGSDNLRDREQRLNLVYTRDSDPIVIGNNGSNAAITAYNRALWLKGGVGHIFPISSKNPDSGPWVHLSAGVMQQKTVLMANEVMAPQVSGAYARLYDHNRLGAVVQESFGYWFMSNRSNLANFYVAFELSQCFTHSTRDYVIDGKMPLSGKDNNHYFDLLYSIKFCWMFPLTGKTARDYYYY